MEKKWFRYKLDHQAGDDEDLTIRKSTQNGVLSVENLSFVIDPEKFPMGVYEIVITDVTEGVEEGWRCVGEDVPAMSSTMLDMPEWTI